jgi:CheY-like chemotaxis protein
MALKMQNSSRSGKMIRCFLIDDDQDDQEIFQLAVDRTEMNVECTVSGDALKALEILRQQRERPDFIFLDLNMPHVDGKMCLTEIKKDPALKDIPVIMYSTSSYINDIRETRRLGAIGFVTKPTNVDELVTILTKIFSKTYKFPSSAYYQ